MRKFYFSVTIWYYRGYKIHVLENWQMTGCTVVLWLQWFTRETWGRLGGHLLAAQWTSRWLVGTVLTITASLWLFLRSILAEEGDNIPAASSTNAMAISWFLRASCWPYRH
jgi:hypothetical protein